MAKLSRLGNIELLSGCFQQRHLYLLTTIIDKSKNEVLKYTASIGLAPLKDPKQEKRMHWVHQLH